MPQLSQSSYDTVLNLLHRIKSGVDPDHNVAMARAALAVLKDDTETYTLSDQLFPSLFDDTSAVFAAESVPNYSWSFSTEGSDTISFP